MNLLHFTLPLLLVVGCGKFSGSGGAKGPNENQGACQTTAAIVYSDLGLPFNGFAGTAWSTYHPKSGGPPAWQPLQLSIATSLDSMGQRHTTNGLAVDQAKCDKVVALLTTFGESIDLQYGHEITLNFEGVPYPATAKEFDQLPSNQPVTVDASLNLSFRKPAAGFSSRTMVSYNDQTFPMQLVCQQPFSFIHRWAATSRSYSGSEATFCRTAQSGSGQECAELKAEFTGDNCSLKMERATLTTKDGEKVMTSVYGHLVKKKGNDAKDIYELSYDRIELPL